MSDTLTPAQDFTAILLNLDHDTARLDHMQKQLARAGVVFVRQPGILGDAVPAELKSYFYHASGKPRTGMKRGEIGCYASHLRALKRVADGDYGDVALIMEDDLDIVPNLLEIVAEARAVLPAHWDIVRLSNPPRRAYAPLAKIGGRHYLARYSKIPNSAGAYLVTRAGAQKFLRHGVRGLTFDDDLRRPWFHGMETFGIVPPPIQAGATRQSSIDAIEAGRFDKGISSRMERILRGDHFYALKRLIYNGRNLGPLNWLACGMINLAVLLAKPGDGESIIHRAARLFPAGRRHA
jgi:glycosyl transferase family 25